MEQISTAQLVSVPKPGLFSFPNPVNELAARAVAAGVVALSALTLLLSLLVDDGWLWLSVLLAYGFIARVAAGPTFSPLGQLATRVIAPRLGPARPTPGPPKRFAQAIGAVVTSAAVVLTAVGQAGPAQILLAMMVLFAGLESALGFCVGCRIFALLMRAGLIPDTVCEACADISRRP
ncbi:hypothetical protein Kisp01_39520 [Kineosporia sp. NBRC 101677]|uniref:DUF4395 domain-containing protein n=1 Tax=Kineosporia sp. NBRC 101677 TaxID=3032197 RepID=UPI0024A38C28|nr:DUF4395 domain-containing protein [Kineosporia sp. NBRC 101677]GLY16937.1 hypothetical protein Kisp01_39520 [Kineosporia sp. NBRC 101677]